MHCIHLVLELQDIPTFADRFADIARAASAGSTANVSPSRGKIRPGKELIILSDGANQESTGTESDEPSLANDSAQLGLQTDSGGHSATASTANATKKFSALSMAERQAEWLRKKQEKMEAERSRQEEEKEKELTFQPKILRRSTFGDKPTKDTPSTAPKMLQRSDTSGGGGISRKLDNSGASEPPPKPSAVPKEKAITRVPPRSAGRRKKPQHVAASQPIEISSELLESMKSELTASISRGAALPRTQDAGKNGNDSNATPEESRQEETGGGGDTSFESPEDLSSQSSPEQLPLKSWSDQPTIGGRRIDFDSSETKARLVLQDASKFELSSMYRKTDKKARRDGVALHMGRREDTFEEEVIAVLFDKEKVSELEAARWWCEHEYRFAEFIRELPPPMDFGS